MHPQRLHFTRGAGPWDHNLCRRVFPRSAEENRVYPVGFTLLLAGIPLIYLRKETKQQLVLFPPRRTQRCPDQERFGAPPPSPAALVCPLEVRAAHNTPPREQGRSPGATSSSIPPHTHPPALPGRLFGNQEKNAARSRELGRDRLLQGRADEQAPQETQPLALLTACPLIKAVHWVYCSSQQ